MARRNWKNVQPTSLRNALELCKDFARERRNLSVERIAELMGLADHSVLYKWLASGRMPAVLIPTYEQVCGCNYVTRWLASAAGRLLIDIPSGRQANAADMQQLQGVLTTATGVLIDFYQGKAEADAVMAAVQTGLEALAWHRANVLQHPNPQFDLGDHA